MSVRPLPPTHSEHELHDELLIAQLAGGDVTPDERSAAERLVTTCPDCADLLADVRSIMAATAALPPPRRARDFRLTEADAASLRRRAWRPSLAWFASPRLALAGPLGAALATLGLAGILISSASWFAPGAAQAPLYAIGNSVSAPTAPESGARDMASAAPGVEVAPAGSASAAAGGTTGQVFGPVSSASAAPSAPAAPSASAVPGQLPAAPSGPVAGGTKAVPVASPAGSTQLDRQRLAASNGPSTPSPSPQPAPIVPLASLALIVIGVGLIVLRRIAGAPAGD